MTSNLNDEFCKDHSGFCVENLLESLLLFFSKSALANEMITKIFKNLPQIPQAGHPFCIILLSRIWVCTGTHTRTPQKTKRDKTLLCIGDILSVRPMLSFIFVSGRENVT